MPLRIAMLDATRRTFRRRITLVTNGAITQLAPVDGDETIIGLGAAP
ncbi:MULTISPECIES: hypothetical protein [Streptomyces]|nr:MULTISPECIES: hypothetical protein [Streptomyces]MDI5903652.1 hypothetical protein [Streptomyces sp. 12257]